jgi:hypothetical protein
MSSCGVPQPTIWGGRGCKAGHDIGPWMGSGPWVGMPERLQCQELRAVAKRWRRGIGEEESCDNMRLEKQIKTNQNFLSP